ncbi:lipase 3 [Megalopta genalis]|uniref:lipase 3 n=1 Tax=Megalopta genalis TaxID=115081 RepID=UPI003FD38CF7
MKSLIVFLSLCILSCAISLDCDPIDDLNTAQLIRKEGYPAEAHIVETEDGYLLTMHRIPGKSGSPAIILQHGVLGSSADWVILGKGKALAYLLADAGYDVWLGNFRGSTYSRAHVNMTTCDHKFWNFSWHESGIYDLPAMIDYVVGQKHHYLRAYIGFSMGTTAFYVMASEKPFMTKYLQSVYSLAPVVYMKHVQSPLKYFSSIATNFKEISYLLGETEFLPQDHVVKYLSKTLCDLFRWEEKICANLMFIFTGFDETEFSYPLLPLILSHTPAGTSTKTMVHFAQEIQSGYFRQYDYGEIGNMLKYKSVSPPAYNLSQITVPITLFCGSNDWLSSSEDVKRLVNELPHEPSIYNVPYDNFNHIDFLWAVDAPKLVYKKLLAMLSDGM